MAFNGAVCNSTDDLLTMITKAASLTHHMAAAPAISKSSSHDDTLTLE